MSHDHQIHLSLRTLSIPMVKMIERKIKKLLMFFMTFGDLKIVLSIMISIHINMLFNPLSTERCDLNDVRNTREINYIGKKIVSSSFLVNHSTCF